MDTITTFKTSAIKTGILFPHTSHKHDTRLTGFEIGSDIDFPTNHTHFGIILTGEVTITSNERKRTLYAGDYFSAVDQMYIRSNGTGIVISQPQYKGMNIFGGPIEPTGRLKYIDGCTDSLLIPPVIKGDPCLNHLHFPDHITQTPHTHPSIRAGVVYQGNGECVLQSSDTIRKIPLTKGSVFLLQSETIHSFNTIQESMDIIVFHPDSDFGPEHDEHPMINRTIVDGVSAKHKENIRTKNIE